MADSGHQPSLREAYRAVWLKWTFEGWLQDWHKDHPIGEGLRVAGFGVRFKVHSSPY